jgi:hypothetical protein
MLYLQKKSEIYIGSYPPEDLKKVQAIYPLLMKNNFISNYNGMFRFHNNDIKFYANYGANISNIFKCRSECCNHTTYNNCCCKKCANINEFYNPWTKTITPTVEPIKEIRSKCKFYDKIVSLTIKT